MMQGAYPNFNPPDKTVTINVWAIALENYGEKEVFTAFKIYLKTNPSGFAPSPGQLIEIIHQFQNKEELNEMQAWGLIVEILNSGSNIKSQFEKLPEVIQKSVGGYEVFKEWANNDNLNREIARQSFSRCYLKEIEKDKMFKKMNINNAISKFEDTGITQKEE